MAVTYTCQTCSELLADLGKHLSQSRHKNVIYDPLDEPIVCEECNDTNIHILHLLRFGLSDMALLCSTCRLKQNDEPLAEYSLSNGSLFAKYPQFIKFRDIECEVCEKVATLSVANGKDKQHIVCRACIKEHGDKFQKLTFVSEDSDDFLAALLGIKEHVPKSSGKHRKDGRRARVKRPKKFDPRAEEKKAHYENRKATEAAFKTGKTIKAVGSEGASPAISRSVTPKPLGPKKVSDTKHANGSKKPASNSVSKSVTTKASQNGRSKDTQNSDKTKLNKIADKKKTPESKSGKEKINEKRESNLKKEKKVESNKADKGPESGTKQKVELKPESKQKPEPKSKSESKSKLEPKSKSEPKLKAKIESKTSLKVEKKGKNESKAPSKHDSKSSNGPLKSDGKTKPKTEKQTKPGNAKSEKPKPENSKPLSREDVKLKSKNTPEASPAPEIVLPPGISKYEPSKTPKLTYDNMNEYFNEMCYNLFLEEKASLLMSNNSMLTAGEFELEWYADQDKKHKQFKISILLTPEILDRYVSKRMQSLKKTPFAVNQSIMLVLGDEIPWYGNIVLAEAKNAKSNKPSKFKRGKRPSNDGPKVLEVIVDLYKWNNMPLPLSVNVNLLKILPVSIPVSRVFIAMSRILNPRFIDMILGQKPIRQIFFKNFLKYTKDTFNDSQKVAIQSVLNNTITVLQGPPGTGKTSTIYEIILQLLENLNTFPILVVAASNIAIDNIAEKLLPKHGNSILRIVSNEKEPEYTRDHPLSSICLHHKVYDGLPEHFQQVIKDMRRPGGNVSQSQYKKLLTTQIDYSDKLIGLARVIFTTTVVAGGNQLKSISKMPVVIMDEATQSSEPTTLIPLSMPGVEKFVFVGDQKQLSSFSQIPNLSLSLFERIIANGSYKTPHMLDTQYRMHPAISEFPRARFYDGLLKDGITADDRKKEGIPANPVVFWDTCCKVPEMTVRSRFREDAGLTYANKGEIDYVEKVLTNLIFEKGVPKSEIGVITPYRGQRDMISSTLQKNELINPEKEDVHVEIDRDDFFNESKPITIHTVSDIMIASIDAFQGREKDFLIMSCVRSNENNKIGFLSDARRMNVALTRARYGLILVGDAECLSSADPLWRDYLTTLREKDSILKSDAFSYN